MIPVESEARHYNSVDRKPTRSRLKKPPKDDIKSLKHKLQKSREEAQQWKHKCQLLGQQYLEEIQKVRLSVEMFKNEVLGTHKDMQMRFIDELILAHKKFQKVGI